MKKFSFNLKNILLAVCFIFVISGALVKLTITNKNNENIDIILKGEAYSYLPKEAQEYVKTIYEKTGELVLTEKNKEENTPYLNPQYVEYLTMTDEKKTNEGNIPTSTIVDYSSNISYESDTLPSSYDLRNVDGKNYVTPIRNQGNLGICWAFATAGVAESHLLKQDDISYTDQSQLISERQLDYATSIDGINDYKNEYVSFIDRKLGAGGNFYISTIAMANAITLNNYNSFKKYNDTDLSKMELNQVLNYNNSLFEVDSTINMPQLSLRKSTGNLTQEQLDIREDFINVVKSNIKDSGAAYVGTYMTYKCRYTDSNTNNTIIDVYGCPREDGHAMQIIGWDDDLEYTYCADTIIHKTDVTNCKNIVNSKGAWILKNSWGDSTQYPYLTYDSLYSQISFIKDLNSSSNKNWNNNYILGSESETAKNIEYQLSQTKITGNEKLKKIKFITNSINSTYTIKILKSDKTYETVTKETTLPGLITVDFTTDIVLDKDSKITITGTGEYIDKVSIFTSNVSSSATLDMEKYNNSTISEQQVRLYSQTKNIPSGTQVTYKLYDENNEDVSDKIEVSNNVVAENNINTSVNFLNTLDSGTYNLKVLYDSNIVSSININYTKMQGTGTAQDPYIITNSTQLSQIEDDLDAYYELGNDIDLTEDTREGGKLSEPSTFCPQGFGWKTINGFNGSLDGKGYSIKGLYQNNYLTCQKGSEWNNNGNGLFGTAYGNVTIKNLILEDFDVTCQGKGSYCSFLVSKYDAKNLDWNDTNVYTATFKNIAIKNSKIKNITNMGTSYSKGLFGNLLSNYGNISISNIYLNFEDTGLKDDGSNKDFSYLSSFLQADTLDIKNIQMTGNFDEDKYDIHKIATFSSQGTVNIKNILSTVNDKQIGKNLLDTVNSYKNINIDGFNVLMPTEEYSNYLNISSQNIINTNVYNFDTQLVELTKKSNYQTWENFDDNWVIKTVDGIPRIPVLKFLADDFQYTSIPDITINQKLNEKVSIYDYITPNTTVAKNINYKSNNENIVKVDENGIIVPQSTGTTTIHIESLYDGYIKDVPITIEYIPHYTVIFDANSGTGKMESVEVKTDNNYKLPANTFVKQNYEFNGWNTKADGSGKSYPNLEEIESLEDKESITLYAQWIGKAITVTFNAKGGTVSPTTKVVRYGETYGELPIPSKAGYGFEHWTTTDNGSGVFNYICSKISVFVNYSELIAWWVENAYTIIYDANGGKIKSDYVNYTNKLNIMSDTLATTYAKNDSSKDVSTNLYEKVGKRFKEWNTESDGTGISYTENQKIQLSNVENDTLRLYAIWELATTTFNLNAEGVDDYDKSVSINYDANSISLEKLPIKDGYIFQGYYTDNNEKIIDSNGNLVSDNIYMKNSKWNSNLSSINLYAKFSKIDDIITINNYKNDNSHISNVIKNTSINNFMNNINVANNMSKKIYKNNAEITDNQALVSTGFLVKVYYEQKFIREYTIVVRGDINGDGKADIADLSKLYNFYRKNTTIEGAYLLASDITDDDKVDLGDLSKYYNFYRGNIPTI